MKTKYVAVLTCLFLTIFTYPVELLAESKDNSVRTSEIPTPSKNGTPSTENGSGSRGDELVKPISLIPRSESLELTTSEHPIFWFYLPSLVAENTTVEFILQDSKGNDVYRTQLTQFENPGMLKISIPEELQPLVVNEKYRWYLTINQSNNLDNDLSVDFITGQVQRIAVPSSVQEKLKTATSQEKAEIYLEEGIYSDALRELAEIYPSQIELIKIWENLLQELNLGSGTGKLVLNFQG